MVEFEGHMRQLCVFWTLDESDRLEMTRRGGVGWLSSKADFWQSGSVAGTPLVQLPGDRGWHHGPVLAGEGGVPPAQRPSCAPAGWQWPALR